jgi:hypothetical protein
MNFFRKYNQTVPPDERTFGKNYLPKCYEATLNKMQELCGKESIWVSIGKTTNTSGWKVADVVTEVLRNDQILLEKSFLLSCHKMYAVNHTITACVFNEAMQTL